MTVHSSTSNSDLRGVLAKGLEQTACRPPDGGNALGIVIAAAVLVVLALGVWEGVVREHGFTPSVVDDKDLWAKRRLEVSSDKETLVLLGKSRMLMGFSPAAFSRRYPKWSVHHLAVQGMGGVGHAQRPR